MIESSQFYLFVFINILILALVHSEKAAVEPVTCGSAVKLLHKETGHHLHSHAIAWGSGSGQQSVTSTGSQNDPGSLWLVKEASNLKSCEAGVPVKCGDLIRLEHVVTGKNLHSHLYKAPLTGNQEVSAFGENGLGDTGDNWKIVCETSDSYWKRGAPIVLSHVDTGKFLFTTNTAQFNQQNCGGGCPIMGQTEISASQRRDVKNRWITGQGVFISPIDENDNEADL